MSILASKTITRISFILAAITWAGLLASDLSILFSFKNDINSGIVLGLPRIMFNLFIFFVFLYYRYRIGKAESVNFVDLLWKVFVTGLLATVISLALRFFSILIGNGKLAGNIFVIDSFYLINLGLATAFLVSTFEVWKKLILYQKSKFLLTIWNIFEYSLLLSLVYNVLPFNFLVKVFLAYVIMLILMGLFLSANMKWVAYLNFKQKWKGILLILLSMLYLAYFFTTLYNYTLDHDVITDFKGNVFIIALFAFIFIYALFSLLVILFNLPTSSVFEKKLEEVVNFQRLSQSIQTEQSEEQVYEILLDSSISTVLADAGWVELYGKNDRKQRFITYQIDENNIEKVKSTVVVDKVRHILSPQKEPALRIGQHLSKVKGSAYKSVMAFQIIAENEKIGSLGLLKDVSDGFNKEMGNIIKTFVNQAGISIENFRLLKQALENERYKEEVKIAKRVQSALLPDVLENNEDFEIVAFSVAADEVGGDYYDTYRINENEIALIIGDVSGKGTSAAFHMSQMKGIFHSLSQMGLSPSEFFAKANSALSHCLERTSFITASYFIINSKNKTIDFARAGHCPTLYYSGKSGEAEYFETKGLGLGILRNDQYHNHIGLNSFKYNTGDVVVLYTDGVTEAKDINGQEFGYDKLKKILEEKSKSGPSTIQDSLVSTLYDFTGEARIDDDYTTVIIKFK